MLTSTVQTGLLQPVLTDLLNSYPASMVYFICFIDDKLLKFYHCNHKITPRMITFAHLWGQLDFYTF